MPDLLAKLAADCPWMNPRHPYAGRCQARAGIPIMPRYPGLAADIWNQLETVNGICLLTDSDLTFAPIAMFGQEQPRCPTLPARLVNLANPKSVLKIRVSVVRFHFGGGLMSQRSRFCYRDQPGSKTRSEEFVWNPTAPLGRSCSRRHGSGVSVSRTGLSFSRTTPRSPRSTACRPTGSRPTTRNAPAAPAGQLVFPPACRTEFKELKCRSRSAP
jgi:hypothetical protein